MTQIFYKARNGAGEELASFVDASTSQEAVAKLKAAGLVEIELHEPPDIAGRHVERAFLSKSEAAQMAAFQSRLRRKPGIATVLGEVARRRRILVVLDVVLLVGGLAARSVPLAAMGFALLASTFGVPIWRHRFARWFDGAVRAMALGQWDLADRMLARYRKRQHADSIELELNFYAAQIRVRQGQPLQHVLARLELMRPGMPPGAFPARLASVHRAAGDEDGVLACMRAAWEATPDDQTRRLDYALAQARLGDLVKAQELLDGVDIEALQVQGRPFVWWARGMIELRNGRPGAQDTLHQGVAGLLEMASPAAWAPTALCSGACALAMQRNGDAAGAKAMVERVWPVLKVHADRRLRAEIDREIGAP